MSEIDFLFINNTNAEIIVINIIIVPTGLSGRCNIGGSSDASELNLPITTGFFLFGGLAGVISSGSRDISGSGALSDYGAVSGSGAFLGLEVFSRSDTVTSSNTGTGILD
jgi:hypothetical protein